jgi:hypothetical protein
MSEADSHPLVAQLFDSYERFALGDVHLAIKGQSLLGGLVLAACFVDYMAMLHGIVNRTHDKGIGYNYVAYVKAFMPGYDAEKLYKDFRCDLVHAYTGLGEYVYVDSQPRGHLQTDRSRNKIIMNVQTFVADVESAFHRFRTSVDSDTSKLQALTLAIQNRDIGFFTLTAVEYSPNIHAVNVSITSVGTGGTQSHVFKRP